MTGFRIAKPDTLAPSKQTRGRKDKPYREWIAGLPCLITLANDVQAAHLSTANRSYGHLGRGKGQKAPDRWTLPLSVGMHIEQHKGNELAFWRRHGINPYVAALALHGLYLDGATDVAYRLIATKELGRE